MISPALHALLNRIIDYAGLYPPASLSCAQVMENYEQYCGGPHAWMLRWLVLGKNELPAVPPSLNGALSVLSESSEPRAAVIESKSVLAGAYCEVPISELHRVKAVGGFGKIRTGGVQPEAIPTVDSVADFIRACAAIRLPFKATAGLHHPIRSMQALTYAAEAPRAIMHGFINVFLAAAFAWHGDADFTPILAEMEPSAFRFDDRAHWRGRSLSVEQIQDARANFVHAFGSCSFTEPVEDLRQLGWL